MSDVPPPREKLATLSKTLLRLHKTLLDSERVGYEASFGKIETPTAFLNLLMTDPWFAWLRSLSEFIAAIDEALGSKDEPVTNEMAAGFLKQARTLLTPAESGEGFSLHYHNAMQRDPDVILAHAGMLKLIGSLESA